MQCNHLDAQQKYWSRRSLKYYWVKITFTDSLIYEDTPIYLFVWFLISFFHQCICLQGHHLRGIRGFFNRSSKSSVDTNTSGLRKRSISDHLLRRTASAPAKGRKKTKMALSESVASISDHRNCSDAGASGGEGPSVRVEEAEKPLQPRAPLIHRPISMPLDRLLQGQLSICSPDKEQHDMGADTIIGGYFCFNLS